MSIRTRRSSSITQSSAAIIGAIRAFAIVALIAIVIWDRHVALEVIIRLIGRSDAVVVIISAIVVITSLIIADYLIWRLIYALLDRATIKRGMLPGAQFNVLPKSSATLPRLGSS